MTEASHIHAENALAWDQTRSWYEDHVKRAAPTLAAGGTTLHPVEQRILSGLPPLGDWCERAVHLQCAAGLDTHSLRNHGARTCVGVDISTELIDVARTLSRRLDLENSVSFVRADVVDLPSELLGTADLVYTGKGAVHWMHDLGAWSRTVASLLRPGGIAVVFDFHPMMWLFRSDSADQQPTGVSYFAPRISYSQWAPGHVGALDPALGAPETKRLRPWPPSAVIQGLLDQGLRLRAFGEYPDSASPSWSAYPRWSPELRRTVATTYSVLVSKPDHS